MLELYRLELYKNKSNEDLKQQNSEPNEKLPVLVMEKSGIHLNLEELQRKLEQAKLLLQQSSSQCEPPDANRQLQQATEEQAQLEAHLGQNGELKEQLAKLQSSFMKLNNENMEITSTLQLEQQVKKELGELKEVVELKSQESQSLKQKQDQYLDHQQQYVAIFQQVTSEKEESHKQLLLQIQLVDQLPQEEAQGKMVPEMACQELQETQECLETATQQKQQLPAQLSLMAPHGEGDGLDSEKEEEKAPRLMLSILENLESRETLKEPEAAALAPGTGGDSVCGKTHWALQRAMEKLQSHFMELMQEKMDLKEQAEKLECRRIQLPAETDTIS
ncbi:Golgin subfamily A member 2 [Plecturocebus cupreus]